MNFTQYANSQSIPVAELITLNRENQCLWAKAENSGSEGYYTEVARWSFAQNRWERFAFCKFLTGDVEGMTDLQAAESYAEQINDAGNEATVIHTLPTWKD